MKTFIRLLYIAGFLLPGAGSGWAADTLKIHLTYKHKVNNMGQTSGYITINQRFYTPEDVLFREINYDETTSQIKNYTFYFYKNNRLYTEECYNQQDSLQYILKHEYDAAGHEILVTRLVPVSGQPLPDGKTVKSYDGNGRIIGQKEYTGKKTAVLTRYRYDDSGKLERESSIYKKLAANSLKTEKKNYRYDATGSLLNAQISGKNNDNKAFQYQETYAYNDKGLVSSIKKSESIQIPLSEKTFRYLDSGAPSLYQESNANGTITLILQYDYKKHYMDRGTQVSFLEGK
jgi:hypothetical protein